ncbi:MAG: FecCD family ABC transporter permease [Panacagrimonas sp.]
MAFASLDSSSRRKLTFAGLAAAVILAALFGMTTGTMNIPLSALWQALRSPADSANLAISSVIWDLRLPRTILALLVGSALACAGAAMQGLFRNPLADPGLVGVASGAALAAVAAIVIGRGLDLPPRWTPFLIPVASFVGGLAAASLAARLASVDGYTRTATLLLAGLAINAIAGAGIGLLIQIAGDTALREATFWLFGSLAKSGWPELSVAAPILLLVLFLLPREARALNTLLLGEAEAAHLGVNVEALKRRVTALIVLAVAVCVALAGVIGFVGLIVPHLLRLVLGPDHRGILPGAALGGAALLGFADIAARTWLSPAELPVGILTALIGGPFFLVLLLRLRTRVDTW